MCLPGLLSGCLCRADKGREGTDHHHSQGNNDNTGQNDDNEDEVKDLQSDILPPASGQFKVEYVPNTSEYEFFNFKVLTLKSWLMHPEYVDPDDSMLPSPVESNPVESKKGAHSMLYELYEFNFLLRKD